MATLTPLKFRASKATTSIILKWLRFQKRLRFRRFSHYRLFSWEVTRARKLPASKTTTFRTAVIFRHRLNPKMDPLYFGNVIQSIPTYASAGDVTSRYIRWCTQQLNESENAHDNETVRHFIHNWEKDPRSGGANKFDGKISPFPGRERNGSVDLEVALAPETMAVIESDHGFIYHCGVAL
ncbi:Calcium-dependent lipid-binding family protein [Hibiscus syriacus]|uniref:Calcium-dependent lipid-binding family protein n=1 Tax=Hibiscus syriacus TaxID=106335 RepID=A0A6A3BL58_HIBSY|nr:Calcium-dependent lipid-binding family protein [Hibiscus syriacus]